MTLMWISAAITVASGVGYHIAQRSFPQTTNPFLLLLPAYLIAFVATGVLALASPARAQLVAALKRPHWASILLGLIIVSLEAGYLLMYRSGWKVSTVPIFTNTIVIMILIPAGALLFSESISIRQAIGIVLAVVAIVLMKAET